MNKGFVQKRRKKKKEKIKEKKKEKRKKKKKKRKKRRSTQTKEKKESKYGLWKLGRGTVRPKDIVIFGEGQIDGLLVAHSSQIHRSKKSEKAPSTH